MIEAPKIAYATKYALTDGISSHAILRVDDSGYAIVVWPGAINGRMGLSASEWAYSPTEAEAKAEAMRLRKIASLKKQISRLEKLKFSAPNPSAAPYPTGDER